MQNNVYSYERDKHTQDFYHYHVYRPEDHAHSLPSVLPESQLHYPSRPALLVLRPMLPQRETLREKERHILCSNIDRLLEDTIHMQYSGKIFFQTGETGKTHRRKPRKTPVLPHWILQIQLSRVIPGTKKRRNMVIREKLPENKCFGSLNLKETT